MFVVEMSRVYYYCLVDLGEEKADELEPFEHSAGKCKAEGKKREKEDGLVVVGEGQKILLVDNRALCEQGECGW